PGRFPSRLLFRRSGRAAATLAVTHPPKNLVEWVGDWPILAQWVANAEKLADGMGDWARAKGGRSGKEAGAKRTGSPRPGNARGSVTVFGQRQSYKMSLTL